MAVELRIPESGESITEVQIGVWLKAEGDHVQRDEPVVEVETDKASMELPAPVSGVLARVLKQAGETCRVGEVIAHIEEAPAAVGTAGGEQPAVAGRREDGPAREHHSGPSMGRAAGAAVASQQRVMPAARRLLAEHGLEAADVEATGPGGRVLKEDVQRRIAEGGARAGDQAASGARSAGDVGTAAPESARVAGPPVAAQEESVPTDEPPVTTGAALPGARLEEVVPMTLLRRRIAERLVEAQRSAALLTTFNEIDMSSVLALRRQHQEAFQQKYGIKLGIMSFFVKAAIDALKLIPQLNAAIRGTDIVYHNYYDIGIAVSTERGLVVPVIRNAERLSFAEVELAIADFARRARDKKILPDELQGGTFTISNGGVFGSLLSTPIVNPPQSGVLGLHAIQERPVAREGQVAVRPMMYVALTYDHRIVDGRESVTFLKRIKECIEDPARMLIEV